MKFDDRSGLLWGVGFDAAGGRAFVIDGGSGRRVAEVQIPGAFPGSFPNDLVVTRDAVYITDSPRDVIWSIPLDRRGRPAGPARAIPLSGDFTFVTGSNLNGIAVAESGQELVAVHSALGVQNFLNQVSVVSLDRKLATGRVTEVVTSDRLRAPSTAARFLNSLYVVNARFDVALPPFLGGQPMTIDYDVVRVRP